MARNGLLGVLAVCLVLGLAGAGALGWIYFTRDRGVAVLNFAVEPGESFRMSEVIEKERKLVASDEVLKPVVEKLGLVDRWKMKSEEEALARLRSKVVLKRGENRVVIVYRDRSQDRAMEIMGAMWDEYVRLRQERVADGELPPLSQDQTRR